MPVPEIKRHLRSRLVSPTRYLRDIGYRRSSQKVILWVIPLALHPSARRLAAGTIMRRAADQSIDIRTDDRHTASRARLAGVTVHSVPVLERARFAEHVEVVAHGRSLQFDRQLKNAVNRPA